MSIKQQIAIFHGLPAEAHIHDLDGESFGDVIRAISLSVAAHPVFPAAAVRIELCGVGDGFSANSRVVGHCGEGREVEVRQAGHGSLRWMRFMKPAFALRACGSRPGARLHCEQSRCRCHSPLDSRNRYPLRAGNTRSASSSL